MKKISVTLFLLAFALGLVFFACSEKVGEENPNGSGDDNPEYSSDSGDSDNSSDSEDNEDNEDNEDYSSDSYEEPSSSSEDYEDPEDPNDTGNSKDKSSSSSSRGNSSPSVSSSLSSSSTTTPSSSSVSSTPSCAYKTDWCGGTAFSSVTKTNQNNANSANNGMICTFATSVSMLENGKFYANGAEAKNCGNSNWGQPACADALASIPKADGGYYIYAPDWYDKLTTTGGTPNCNSNGNGGGGNPSSSSTTGGGGISSSSTTTGGSGTPSYTPTTPGTSTAKTTQYWDACKPSCSWSGKGGKQANSCNITGGNIGHNDMDKSACDGGTAFTCMNQAPWKVGNVSFGYAAINMGTCGDCYQLDFPNGQVMVVMKSNIGQLNEGAAFDIMIPGGGVGNFDALTRQVQQSGVSNPNMGERYGGFRMACKNVASCVKQKCEEVFAKLPDLKAGCLWYATTLGTDNASFDNPVVKYKLLTTCPKELTDKY